jgi:hypothetical protein
MTWCARVRAVELIRVWSAGADLTPPRLLTVAEQHSDRFGDQEVEGVSDGARAVESSGCSQWVANRSGAARDGDPRADRWRRGRRPRALRSRVRGVARAGVGRCADELDRRGGERDGGVSARCGDLVLGALRGLGTETRTRVLAAVEETIQRDDATASALARVRGLPAPTLPAPSPEECKRAIGLA